MKIALGWPCTNLGALLAQPQKKQWCPVSTESTSTCFRGKVFLHANLHKAGCRKTLMSKEYTYACFGGQAFQGQTRNLNQSHLGRGKQGWCRRGGALGLSVSAPLTSCGVAACWHAELSTLNLLLLWLNTYLSNSFNSSIHVFHSKIALGWRCTNLGALLAQPQKNNDV